MSTTQIEASPESILRLAELRRQAAEAGAKRFYLDPVGFVNECVRGCELTEYQAEILHALPKQQRVSLRGPHGLGKSTISALAVLWFALTRDALERDWKAVTTAGGWRQLERYLWPEIHKWARHLHWERLGRGPMSRDELLRLNLKLSYGQAFAVASDDPGLIEGVHADEVLYIFDEAKKIPSATFDAAEGAFAASGAGDKVAFGLVTSTPGEPAGRFYEIQAKRPGFEDWWSKRVTVEEAIEAGRISESWVAQRRLQWGESSPVFQNRVFGNFASSEDGVIPLAWVEAAIERWYEWREASGDTAPITRVGVDVARSGTNQSCLALRSGDVVTELRYFAHQSTMATAGRVKGILDVHDGCAAVVDTDGLGAGVTDRLRELEVRVEAFHAGSKSELRDRSGELGMNNLRAAAWWQMRELLDPAFGAEVALPDDDLLIGDLTTPTWRVLSGSKVQIEEKKEIAKRIGRSTDAGDAVVMAFYAEPVRKGGRMRYRRN